MNPPHYGSHKYTNFNVTRLVFPAFLIQSESQDQITKLDRKYLRGLEAWHRWIIQGVFNYVAFLIAHYFSDDGPPYCRPTTTKCLLTAGMRTMFTFSPFTLNSPHAICPVRISLRTSHDCQCVLDKAFCVAETEVPPWNSGTVICIVYRIATNHEHEFTYCSIVCSCRCG
jgi:hypothetical protein